MADMLAEAAEAAAKAKETADLQAEVEMTTRLVDQARATLREKFGPAVDPSRLVVADAHVEEKIKFVVLTSGKDPNFVHVQITEKGEIRLVKPRDDGGWLDLGHDPVENLVDLHRAIVEDTQ